MLNIGGLQCLMDYFGVASATRLMRQSAHAHHFFNAKGKIQGRGLRQDSEAIGHGGILGSALPRGPTLTPTLSGTAGEGANTFNPG
mgnify:CR=1 FL=1